MRMFRSFVLRISLILSTTATISLFLMTVTLGIQGVDAGMIFCGLLFVFILGWLIVNFVVQRKIDPELSVEVARILYPSGALLSLLLSLMLSMQLDFLLPGSDGNEHYIVLFVGIGVALFLLVRCFDIKWLRGEAEILSLEERGE